MRRRARVRVTCARTECRRPCRHHLAVAPPFGLHTARRGCERGPSGSGGRGMRMRGVVCGCGAVRADPAFGNKSRWHATREPSPLRGDGPVCCLGRIRRGCACSVCVCVCVCSERGPMCSERGPVAVRGEVGSAASGGCLLYTWPIAARACHARPAAIKRESIRRLCCLLITAIGKCV